MVLIIAVCSLAPDKVNLYCSKDKLRPAVWRGGCHWKLMLDPDIPYMGSIVCERVCGGLGNPTEQKTYNH